MGVVVQLFSSEAVVAEYERAVQQPDPAGPDRWSIQGGDYRWYLPDLLTGRPLTISPETREQLEIVTQQVVDLGRRLRERPLPARYATLLRSESIASSRIEGVREDPSAVLLADIDETAVPEHSAAQTITRNIDTVRRAVETLATRTTTPSGRAPAAAARVETTSQRAGRSILMGVTRESSSRVGHVRLVRLMRLARAVGVVVGVVLGGMLAVVGTAWLGLGGGELGTVWIHYPERFSQTVAPSWAWAGFTATLVAALALLAGPRPPGRISVTSVLGSSWMLTCLGAFSWVRSKAELTGSEPPCVRRGCWPNGWQELAVAAPLGVAALTLLVLGLVGGQAPSWVRRGLPATVLIVLVVVQVEVWEPLVVPALLGPPPG